MSIVYDRQSKRHIIEYQYFIKRHVMEYHYFISDFKHEKLILIMKIEICILDAICNTILILWNLRKINNNRILIFYKQVTSLQIWG